MADRIKLVMGTKDFNFIDKFIARWRLSKVIKQIKKGEAVLDFGCGSQGYFLKQISPVIKNGVGLDYEVRNEKIGNLKFASFKFRDQLPFEKETFDKVVMLAVLEHIELDKVKKLFDEYRRVLKKDGRIILTTPTPKSKNILECLAYLNIISRKEIKDHKKYYAKRDVAILAKNSSLKLVGYRLFQLGLNSEAILVKN